jgi:hypothetical protein
MIDFEMFLDPLDIVGHRFADNELCRGITGRRSGRAKREEAYIAAPINDEIRLEGLVKMVLVPDRKLESTLKVARKFGVTYQHGDVSFGASISYGYLAMMNEWPQESAPEGPIFRTSVYARREQQLPTT